MDKEAIFGRQCRLLIGTGGSSAIDVSDLRYTFNIVKAMTQEPNYCEVTVYNLGDKGGGTAIKAGNTIILEAGYEGDRYGLIFRGLIYQTIRGQENGTDTFLKLICLDSAKFVNKAFVNTTIQENSTLGEVVQVCFKDASTPISGDVPAQLEDTILSRPKTVFGQSSDYLRQIAQGNNMQFYTNDGQAHLITNTSLSKTTALVLTPYTGLVDYPTVIEGGVQAQSLLHPGLNIGSFVHISSRLIENVMETEKPKTSPYSSSGLYRIIKVTHVGDTRGTEWYSNIEGIVQAGTIPSTIETSEWYMF